MAEGGAAGIADRARNERLTRIVDNERLTRMQGLLRSEGINMTKRELAMAQNGDLNLNVSPDVARQLRAAGLINDRSEEHTSELQSLMRISYAVFCLKKKKINNILTLYIMTSYSTPTLYTAY